MEKSHLHNLALLIFAAPTCYHALGCEPDTGVTDIHKNYRKLRKILLTFVDSSQLGRDAMARLMFSWAVLKCPETRTYYDQIRFPHLASQQSTASSSSDNPGGTIRGEAKTQDKQTSMYMLRIPEYEGTPIDPQIVGYELQLAAGWNKSGGWNGCELCDPDTPFLTGVLTSARVGRYGPPDEDGHCEDMAILVCPFCDQYVKKSRTTEDDNRAEQLEQRDLDAAIQESWRTCQGQRITKEESSEEQRERERGTTHVKDDCDEGVGNSTDASAGGHRAAVINQQEKQDVDLAILESLKPPRANSMEEPGNLAETHPHEGNGYSNMEGSQANDISGSQTTDILREREQQDLDLAILESLKPAQTWTVGEPGTSGEPQVHGEDAGGNTLGMQADDTLGGQATDSISDREQQDIDRAVLESLKLGQAGTAIHESH